MSGAPRDSWLRLVPGHSTPAASPELVALERIARGDSGALESLYDAHASVIHAICLRMLRDRGDAEDMTQEVFWQLWSHPERYEAERASLRTYLVQIARSRCLDRLRRDRRRDELLAESKGELEPDRDPNRENPAESALATENRHRVLGALATLSAAEREAIVMAYFDGLSQSEIAAKLGDPLGTVKTRIRRGLTHLRDNLASKGGDA